MERERINKKTASRVIQQKQNHGINGMVDNRPYSSFPFLSNPTAQRLSEDDEETMQGKFDSSVQRMEDEDEETLQGKFESPVQRVSEEDEDTLQGKFDKPIQKKNETGMPDNLKAGIESLSGFSMDDVRVHYNSSKPATVQALAYTQGTDIHVAPGQEKHLPHEAWHVAQQMAGRVSPTTNINGMPVNDNPAFEHEADVMGEKAQNITTPIQLKVNNSVVCKNVVQLKLAKGKLNVVGEQHNISDSIRDIEKNFVSSEIPDGKYWMESDFVFKDKDKDVYGDSPILRMNFIVCFIDNYFNNLYSSVYDPDKMLKESQTNILKYLPEWISNIDYIRYNILSIVAELIRFKASFSDEEIKKMSFFTSNVINHLDLSKLYLLLLDPWLRTPANQDVLNQVIMFCGLIKDENNKISQLFDTIKKQFYFSTPHLVVAKLRSDHMHEIANSKSSEHGVWKIGDSHREDLAKKNEKDRKYNLISEEQFTKDLNEYTSKKNSETSSKE